MKRNMTTMNISSGIKKAPTGKSYAPNQPFIVPFKQFPSLPKRRVTTRVSRMHLGEGRKGKCPAPNRGGVFFQTKTGGSLSLPKQRRTREEKVRALGGTKLIHVRKANVDKYGLTDLQAARSARAKLSMERMQRLVNELKERGLTDEDSTMRMLKDRMKQISLSAYSVPATIPGTIHPPPPPPVPLPVATTATADVDERGLTTMEEEEEEGVGGGGEAFSSLEHMLRDVSPIRKREVGESEIDRFLETSNLDDEQISVIEELEDQWNTGMMSFAEAQSFLEQKARFDQNTAELIVLGLIKDEVNENLKKVMASRGEGSTKKKQKKGDKGKERA